MTAFQNGVVSDALRRLVEDARKHLRKVRQFLDDEVPRLAAETACHVADAVIHLDEGVRSSLDCRHCLGDILRVPALLGGNIVLHHLIDDGSRVDLVGEELVNHTRDASVRVLTPALADIRVNLLERRVEILDAVGIGGNLLAQFTRLNHRVEVRDLLDALVRAAQIRLCLAAGCVSQFVVAAHADSDEVFVRVNATVVFVAEVPEVRRQRVLDGRA